MLTILWIWETPVAPNQSKVALSSLIIRYSIGRYFVDFEGDRFSIRLEPLTWRPCVACTHNSIHFARSSAREVGRPFDDSREHLLYSFIIPSVWFLVYVGIEFPRNWKRKDGLRCDLVCLSEVFWVGCEQPFQEIQTPHLVHDPPQQNLLFLMGCMVML